MTQHCFMKNVRVLNADSAVYMWGALHTTLEGVEVGTPAPRGPEGAGHRGIWLEHGAENLVTR